MHGAVMEPSGYSRLVVSTVLLLFVVAGNSLVIAAYKVNPRLRTATFTLLLSLAVSDLMVGTVSLPLWIYCGTVMKWQVSYSLRVFYLAFDIFTALASVLQLTLISLERFVAISRPFFFKTLRPQVYISSIVSVWVLSAVLAGLYPLVYRQSDKVYLKAYTLSFIFVFFVFPMIVVTVMNVAIFGIVKTLTHRAPHVSCNAASDSGQSVRKERRTALTLAVVTALFYAAWLPFFVVTVLAMFCSKSCLPTDSSDALFLMEFIKWLQYSQSMFNPLVYTFRDREIRRTFLRIILWCQRGRVFAEIPSTNVQPSSLPTPSLGPLVLNTLRIPSLVDEQSHTPSTAVTEHEGAMRNRALSDTDYDEAMIDRVHSDTGFDKAMMRRGLSDTEYEEAMIDRVHSLTDSDNAMIDRMHSHTDSDNAIINLDSEVYTVPVMMIRRVLSDADYQEATKCSHTLTSRRELEAENFQ